MAIAKHIKEKMQASSWIRKMFEQGAALKKEFGAENVFDFSLGNPDVAPPAEFQKALEDTARDKSPGKHAYMPNGGYPFVREEVARQLSREQETKLDSSSLIMTCGAGGGLNVVLKTILNPDEEVIVSAPYFVEYGFYCQNHNGHLRVVKSTEDFNLDLEAIGQAITEKTAAVLINSPNNPSGKVYDRESIIKLGKLLEEKSRQHGRVIYLLSDEPYRKLVFDGITAAPIFPAYKNSIVVSSYSKDLSIPGERLGYAVVNSQADDFDQLIAGMTLCNRILGFVNAPAFMQRVCAKVQGISVDAGIYQKRRDLLCEGLEKIGYRFIKPQGAFYLFPQAPGGDDLATVDALQKERILTVPGRGFGSPGYFRISFCVKEEIIKGAMEGFAAAFKKLQKD